MFDLTTAKVIVIPEDEIEQMKASLALAFELLDDKYHTRDDSLSMHEWNKLNKAWSDIKMLQKCLEPRTITL